MHAAHLAAQAAYASVARGGALQRPPRGGAGPRRPLAGPAQQLAGPAVTAHHLHHDAGEAVRERLQLGTPAGHQAQRRRVGRADHRDPVAGRLEVEGQGALDAGHRDGGGQGAVDVGGHGVLSPGRGSGRGRVRRWPGSMWSGSAPMTSRLVRVRPRRRRRRPAPARRGRAATPRRGPTACPRGVRRPARRPPAPDRPAGSAPAGVATVGAGAAGSAGRRAAARASRRRRRRPCPRAPSRAADSSARRRGAGHTRRALSRPSREVLQQDGGDAARPPSAAPSASSHTGAGDQQVTEVPRPEKWSGPSRCLRLLVFTSDNAQDRPVSIVCQQGGLDHAVPGQGRVHDVLSRSRGVPRCLRRCPMSWERSMFAMFEDLEQRAEGLAPRRARRRGRRPEPRGVHPGQPGRAPARLLGMDLRLRLLGGRVAGRPARPRRRGLGDAGRRHPGVDRPLGRDRLGGAGSPCAPTARRPGRSWTGSACARSSAGSPRRPRSASCTSSTTRCSRAGSARVGKDFVELHVGEGSGRAVHVVPLATVAALQGRG